MDNTNSRVTLRLKRQVQGCIANLLHDCIESLESLTAPTLTNVFPEGMDNLSELKCLYLHNNRIENLSVSIDFKIIIFNWN